MRVKNLWKVEVEWPDAKGRQWRIIGCVKFHAGRESEVWVESAYCESLGYQNAKQFMHVASGDLDSLFASMEIVADERQRLYDTWREDILYSKLEEPATDAEEE